MPRIVGRIGAAALVSSVASISWADVTPEDVWQDWKDYSERMGQTVETGSEVRKGDTLAVNDLKITMDMGDGGFATVGMDSVEFKDLGDGTVAIITPAEQVLSMEISPPDDQAVMMDILLSHEGMKTIASGDPGATGYDLSAKRLTVSSEGVTVGGVTTPLSLMVALNDVVGGYNFAGEDGAVSSQFNASDLTYDVSVVVDKVEGEFLLSGSLKDIKSNSVGMMPTSIGMMDFPAMLAAGFSSEGGFSHSGSNYDVSFREGPENFKSSGSSASGALEFALNSTFMRYAASSRDIDMTMSGSEIPLPEVALKLGESAFDMKMPVGASEDPQDFGMLIRLVGLEISEGIWGLFDPAQQLPRDPATLIIDIVGKGNMFFDPMDPESAAMMDSEVPGELHEMTLNDVTLTLAGLNLNGMGGFTFDNEDLITFSGMPKPTGTLNLRLEGLNKFLDTLVGMGLMPEDQAMGTRMMLSMFAEAGETDDTLVSVIEVTEEGAVMANGQRLQ